MIKLILKNLIITKKTKHPLKSMSNKMNAETTETMSQVMAKMKAAKEKASSGSY
jgi:hypothetical protein